MFLMSLGMSRVLWRVTQIGKGDDVYLGKCRLASE